MERVKDNAGICAYLPDLEGLNNKQMDRQFLFDVVNTLEPTFFRRCLEEVSEINRG